MWSIRNTRLMRAAAVVWPMLCLAACAGQPPLTQQSVKKNMTDEAPTPVDQLLPVLYRCDNLRLILAVYDNRDPALSRVRLSAGAPNPDGTWSEQASISMHQVRSGSGVLYVADQHDQDAQWHSKGDEAVWTSRKQGHQSVVRCVAQP